MADFYSEMRAVANSVIGDFQQGTITYTGMTKGKGPADDPGEPVERTVVIPAVARGVQFKYIDGSNVVATDGQVTFPAGIVEPSIEGYITIDGKRARIVQVVAIPPAGTTVAYTVVYKR